MSETAAKLNREKTIYVNDIMMPIEDDFLTSTQILARAGFVPERYNLYLKTGDAPKDYSLMTDKTPIEIQNGKYFRAVPNITGLNSSQLSKIFF